MTRRTTGAGRRHGFTAAAFLAPFFVLFVCVMLVPIGYAVYLSLFTQHSSGLGFGGTQQVFDGLGNYAKALTDPKFDQGFLHILGYCVIYIPVMLCCALAVALLLDSAAARCKRFFQLAVFLPHAVPGLIAAMIWVYLYTPGLSPVVEAMKNGGLDLNLFSSGAALPTIVNIAVWEWTGYNMVIFYAALQAIPKETIEAATVDGAGGWRTAWSVKIPLIRSSVVMTLLFTLIGSLQLFTEPLLVSGSSSAVDAAWTPNMYAYSAAFDDNDFGLAAAASVLMALVGAGLSFAVTRIANRKGAKPA